MRSHSREIFLVAVAAFVLPSICSAGDEQLKVGMAKTFFGSTPKVFVNIAGKDFDRVIKNATGFGGELNTDHGPFELGQRLKDRKLDFAIFHGHEFASVREKDPGLVPLLIVSSKDGERAYLIVRQDSNAQSAADLGGKKVNLPLDTRRHCDVFLAKMSTDHGQKGAKFFGSVAKSTQQIEALNDLASGKVDAVIVDTVGLAAYKDLRGPVFEKNLRILESEPFPSPVVVYRRGALEEKVINQFRDGLLKAHLTDTGRVMMESWKINCFAPVPEDYEKTLSETFKAHPLAAPLDLK